jgi:hypothetical protein
VLYRRGERVGTVPAEQIVPAILQEVRGLDEARKA